MTYISHALLEKIRNNNKRYYPGNIRKLLAKKKRLWQLHRRFKNNKILLAFKACAAECRREINSYIRSIEYIYRYVNKTFITKSSIAPLSRSDGSITNDPQEKSEILNNYFSTVFTANNGDNLHFPPRVQDGIELNNILFIVESVLKKIKNLNPNSSSGPDGIHIHRPSSHDH